MKRNSVTIGIALLSVFAGWHLFELGEPVHRKALPVVMADVAKVEQMQALMDTVASLKRELALLQRAYHDLSRDVTTLRATLDLSLSLIARASDTSGPEYHGEAVQAEEWDPQAEDAKTSEMVFALDRRLDSEPEDSAWSHSTERAIATAVHSEGMVGVSLYRVECRSTLCRMDIGHEDGQSQLTVQLPHEPPFDGEMLVQSVTDDLSPRSVIYLSRAGYPLLKNVP